MAGEGSGATNAGGGGGGGASNVGGGGGAANVGGGGGGFRGRMQHYLYSGDKKHVFGGIVVIGAIFGLPWFFMSRGSKHQSHQDYMEKADKARQARLSSSQPSK